MGYTHYWYRPRTIPDALFRAIRLDFDRLILPLHDLGIELAGPSGKGVPQITDGLICFNGINDCGHRQNEGWVVAYPSDHAEGVGPGSRAVDGRFHDLGVTVRHRCCNGRCSFETFVFAKSMEPKPRGEPDENGLHADSVRTAFRPYDIAVTAALVVAKRHLGDRFVVHSNGGDAQWVDAKRLCQWVLGYGDWFGIIERHPEEEWAGESIHRGVPVRTLIEMQTSRLLDGV